MNTGSTTYHSNLNKFISSAFENSRAVLFHSFWCVSLIFLILIFLFKQKKCRFLVVYVVVALVRFLYFIKLTHHFASYIFALCSIQLSNTLRGDFICWFYHRQSLKQLLTKNLTSKLIPQKLANMTISNCKAIRYRI